MDLKIYPSADLKGSWKIPGSKSQTLRALFSAMLAKGITIIDNPLVSEDTQSMIGAIKAFGVKVIWAGDRLYIHSPGLKGLTPPKACYVGDSGITLRFMSAFASRFKTRIEFRGTPELERQRSVSDLAQALGCFGVQTSSKKGFCPFTVRGPLKRGIGWLKGKDSQPVSALLWALSLQNKRCVLKVTEPSEKPWVDLTLSWLKKQQKKVTHQDYQRYDILGGIKVAPFYYKVPADFSSVAFLMAAGIFVGEEVELCGLDFSDKQGDKALIYFLKSRGAQMRIEKEKLYVYRSPDLTLGMVSCDKFIDALPVLSVLGVISKNGIELTQAIGARGKESDRIHSMVLNLQSLGLDVQEHEEGLSLKSGEIEGGVCHSFSDHRIAMSMAIIALKAKNPVIIQGAEAIGKTYPTFFEDLKKGGVKIEVVSLEQFE